MGKSALTDTVTSAFLSLVRSGLWDRPLSEEEYSSLLLLSSEEWEAVWSMAGRQTVTGLLDAAFELLPQQVTIPPKLDYAAMADADRLTAAHARQKAAVEELTAFFGRYGLTPVYLKGLEAAALYSRPELRELGDIDVYFPEADFEKALAAIRTHAADTLYHTPDDSVHFSFRGIDVDVHPSYFDLATPAESLPPVGSPEARLFMLNVHILKHACGIGIGLRQLCDMSRAYARLDYSEEQYRFYCEKSGILRWTRLLSSFLRTYLGADSAPLFGEPALKPGRLFHIVRRGGNFGHHLSGRRAALERHPFLRKADTFYRFLQAIPFSLRFAPGQSLSLMKTLFLGQFKSIFR